MKHRSQRGEWRAAAILALFLAVLLLAGCGPQTPQPTATQPPASPPAATPAPTAPPAPEPTPEEGCKSIYVFSNGAQFLDPTVYPWEGGEGEKQPRTVFYWMDDNGSVYREEKMYAMTEEQRDSLLKLLDGAVRSSSYDQVIARIVQEEAGALFAGQREVAEVATRIQERVLLYMAEQGG